MNKKRISIIVGTALGSLMTTTSYASPSEACLDARLDFLRVMDVIQECKGFLPQGKWICTSPQRSVATSMKNDGLAILRHKCRPDVFPDDPGGVCDPDALEESVCLSVVGRWAVSLDINCDGRGDVNRTTVYHDDGTWNAVGFPNGGPWEQNLCAIKQADIFFKSPVIWTSTLIDGRNNLSGIYSGVFNGCWTATRIQNGANSMDIPANVMEENGSSGSFYK